MAAHEAKHVWELVEKIGICMLANWDGQELRSRPMSAHAKSDENAIYFLTDVRHHSDADIQRYPKICLSFGDTGDQKYVSLSGEAEISNDRALARELWSVFAKAWWDSPEDANIRVLKFTPDEAQYWDAPGTTVSYVKMIAAAATGHRPDMGENRKVAM